MFFCKLLLAQQPDYLLKENSVWTFGSVYYYMLPNNTIGVGMGLNFNTANPTTFPAKATGYGVAQASVCDTNGNLLFYTDGTYVVDAHGNLMLHGDSLVTDTALYKYETNYQDINHIDPTSGSTQGALIVPVIGAANKYYIFSNTSGMVYYSIVNMALNNGSGDVDVSHRGILLGSGLNQSLVAVAGTHCDVWVLVHSIGSSTIKAYRVTASGVDTTPVISHYGIYLPTAGYEASIKVSPDRKRISICTYYGGGELCDFDPATGLVSNSRFLNNDQFISTMKPVTSYFFHQSCFSPDNSKVYVLMYNEEYGYVIQFDLTDTTLQTSSVIDSDASITITDIQLAPDGKIYFLHYDFTSNMAYSAIDRIDHPNLLFPACNYHPNAISLYPGSTVNQGLHNMYVKPLPGVTTYVTHPDTGLCQNADSLLLIAPPGFGKYVWSTGDTDQVKPVYGTGTYSVKSGDVCNIQYDTFKVQKVDDAFSLGPDSVFCASSVMLSVPIQNAHYLWQDGDTTGSYKVSQSGIYSVQVSELGCTYGDTIQIGINNVQQALGDDTVICMNGQNIQLVLNANVPADGIVTWSNGSNTKTIIADTGSYWVIVTDGSCVGSDTINIQGQQCNCGGLIPNAFTPNGDGKNDFFHIVFEAGCPINEYTCKIFNRWGNIVFSSADPIDGWDGTYHGQKADVGSYMYEIEFFVGTDYQNVRQFKGNIVLVR